MLTSFGVVVINHSIGPASMDLLFLHGFAAMENG